MEHKKLKLTLVIFLLVFLLLLWGALLSFQKEMKGQPPIANVSIPQSQQQIEVLSPAPVSSPALPISENNTKECPGDYTTEKIVGESPSSENLVFSNQDIGVTFELPTPGYSGKFITSSSLGEHYGLDIQIEYKPGIFESAYYLSLTNNCQGLSLDEWFAKNVDAYPPGVLINTKTFVKKTFKNGAQAYVGTWPLPDAYTGGPTSNYFAMVPGTHHVLSFSAPQDHSPDFPGFQDKFEAVQSRVLDSLKLLKK